MGQAAKKYREEWKSSRHKLEVIEKRPGPKGQQKRPPQKRKKVRTQTKSQKSRAFVLLRRPRLFMFCSVVLTLGLLLTTLVSYNALTIANRELVETTNKIEKMEAQYNALEKELAPYIELDRIESIAKNRLHMSRPEEDQIMKVTVEPSQSVSALSSFQEVANNNYD